MALSGLRRASQLQKWLKMSDQQGGVQLTVREFGCLSVVVMVGFVGFGAALMKITAPEPFAPRESMAPPSEAYKDRQRELLQQMRAEADARTTGENLEHALHAWEKMNGIKR